MHQKRLFVHVLWMLFVGFGLLTMARVQPAAAVAYTIAISLNGSGSVTRTPDQPTYTAGTQVELKATPAPGWRFVRWQGNFETPVHWWHQDRRYRLPLSVATGDFARQDKPAELAINFTDLLPAAGAFDPASLRVVEVDADGLALDTAVPFQFDPAPDYDPVANAAGTLLLLLTGATPAATTRSYHVYFDTTDNGPFTPAAVAPRVTVADDVLDEAQLSYRVETANATYYYHKEGGGLSSLVDGGGNDWLNYHPTGNSAGNYRGIPNTYGGDFHPGTTGGQSTLLSSGPLRVSILTERANPYEAARWDIYPAYATLTMLAYSGNYWVLYEGTPGGLLEPATDFVVRSDGTQTAASVAWTGDIVDREWVYFADPNVSRSLFMVNHVDDTLVDSYYQMQNNMTVFGFGRTGTTPYLQALPAQFSVGLLDATDYATTGPQINAAYTAVAVTPGTLQAIGADTTRTQPVLALAINNNLALTAVFEPLSYTLDVSTQGSGMVTISPDKATYAWGDQVTLYPQPAVDWQFAHWAGDVASTADPLVLTIEDDVAVTAVFEPRPYTSYVPFAVRPK